MSVALWERAKAEIRPGWRASSPIEGTCHESLIQTGKSAYGEGVLVDVRWGEAIRGVTADFEEQQVAREPRWR
jgi:hypothetical protein